MVSCTEGEIMTVKRKEEPIGVSEPTPAMAKLYWEILRNNPDYKEDYKKLMMNYTGKESWFEDKWSILEPLDPNEDLNFEDKAIYFFPDNTPQIPVTSRGVSKGSYTLHLELDLRCEKSTIIEETSKLIDKEREKFREHKFPRNLFGNQKKRSEHGYKNLLYVYNLKLEGKEPEEIYTTSIKDKQEFYSKGSVIHDYRIINKYINNFPVPINK
jgi:hypothetical protein